MNPYDISVTEEPDNHNVWRNNAITPVWLYSHSSMNELAKSVANRCKQLIKYCNVKQKEQQSECSSDNVC